VLELTPKAKSAIKKMKWWVDQTTWLPIKSEVVEQNGDISTFTLSDIKTNGAMSDAMFKIKVAKGTKEIRR